MGVHGLWQLLQPAGRPITLESLSDQVLAVDVSMWLHQLMKGMRDRHGNPVPNAHLIGLYHRVCKLLYYRVKPVFVFDGGVPVLKKQTLVSRKQKQEDASQTASGAAKKLLTNLMKQNALSAVLGTSSSTADVSLKPKAKEKDIFELTPLQQNDRSEPRESFMEIDSEEEDGLIERNLHHKHQNVNDIDVESEEFHSLPPEVRHELLSELKATRKQSSWSKIDSLPKDAEDFSGYQLSKLIKQSKLSQKITHVRKEMVAQSAGEVVSDMVPGSEGHHIEAQCITSEDASHYILIHGIQGNKDAVTQGAGVDNDDDDGTTSSEPKHVSMVEARTDSAHQSGALHATRQISYSTGYKSQNKSQKRKKAITAAEGAGICDNICLSSDSEESCDERSDIEQADLLAGSPNSSDSPSQHLDDKNVSILKPPPVIEIKQEVIPIPEAEINVNRSQSEELMIKKSEVKDEVVKSLETSMVVSEQNQTGDRKMRAVNSETGESSDDEESFLEVVVDIKNPQPDDELFPASIFEVGDDASQSKHLLDISTDDVPPLVIEGMEVSSDENDFTEAITEDVSEEPCDVTLPEVDTGFITASQSNAVVLQEMLSQERAALQQEFGQQERLATSITDQMQAEAQELLRLFGVPFLVSPMEAEAQCAKLELLGLVEGSVTDDSDVWLFGGQRVYRNVFNQNRHVEMYRVEDLVKTLLLDRRKLVNLALLCGSDYTSGIAGVGPITAMEILAEFSGEGIEQLEKFRSWWIASQTKVKVISETKVKSKLRRLSVHEGFPNPAVVEAYMNPAVDDSDDSFTWGTPDLDLLRLYAKEKFGWQQERVDESLLPVMKQLSARQAQSTITKYFPTEFAEPRSLKSKRMKRVINVMKTSSPEKAVSPKGKALRGKPVQRKSSSKKIDKQGASGGFVERSKPQPVPKEVVLSASSSDDDIDQFDLHDDIGDDLLRNIDLDSISSDQKVTHINASCAAKSRRGCKVIQYKSMAPSKKDLAESGIDDLIKNHKGSKITLSLDQAGKTRKRPSGSNAKQCKRKSKKVVSREIKLSESSGSE